ncbi:unnamed protein product [Victoria cruziana]
MSDLHEAAGTRNVCCNHAAPDQPPSTPPSSVRHDTKGSGDRDACLTPTSPRYRIPVTVSCPPAPKRKPGISRQRSGEIKAVFRRIHLEFECSPGRKPKRSSSLGSSRRMKLKVPLRSWL